MSDIKTKDANVQTPRPKRITHVIFITLIVMLLLLSISGFLIILKANGKDFQRATKTDVPTPTPSPTSIYLETPPAQSEFYDTFKNNALGWSTSSTAGYYRTIKPGELILMNTNRGTTMVESLPTNSVFDNCTVIVDLTILKAGLNDSVGIYIRGDSNLEHDYRIDLNDDGTFDIAKEYLDSRNLPQSVILVGPRSDSALHPLGKRNTITLTMNGSLLQLFINNTNVSDVTDSDYVSGQVALFAHLDEDSQVVKVAFNKVEIDKLKRGIEG
jgi:3-keto-disaccharide hydrolase